MIHNPRTIVSTTSSKSHLGFLKPHHSFMLVVAVMICMTGRFAMAQDYDLSPGKKVTFRDVTFKKGSFTLDKAALPAIDKLGEYLQKRPEMFIEIGGHSDAKGKTALNPKLSEQRAQAIKTYLVTKYKLNPANVATKGYGSNVPVADNNTEAGRTQNRRIEVIAQTGLTKRIITGADDKPLNAEATLSAFEKKVITRAPWDADFVNAKPNQPLYELHKINTGDQSRAEVLFKDQSKMQIGEKSLVIIYGAPGEDKGAAVKNNFELVRGDLLTKLRSMRPGEKVSIKTPSSQLTLNTTRTKLGVDNADRSTVSVHEGKTSVEAAGKVVEVLDGFGTQIIKGSQPEAPRPLPGIPQLIEPTESTITPQASAPGITFSWKPASVKSRLEIARDPDFNLIVVSKITDKSSDIVTLEPGAYYWQVNGIDDIGLEGKSANAHKIQVTQSKFEPARDPTRQANIQLISLKDIFVRTNSDAFEVNGKVDPGSTVVVDSIPVKNIQADGTFSIIRPLKEGENRIVIEAKDSEGYTARRIGLVRYVAPDQSFFSIGFETFTPIGYPSYKAGIGGRIDYLYQMTPTYGLMVGVGAGTLKSQKDSLSNQFANYYAYGELRGLAYLIPTSEFSPYVIASLSLIGISGSNLTTTGAVETLVAPGAGLGMRIGSSQGGLHLTGFYRYMPASSSEVDPKSTGSRGIFEFQVQYIF
jgi:hypothetical protein